MAQTETQFSPSYWAEPTRAGAEVAGLEVAAPTSRAGLEAALQAADAGYYTDARLATLGRNDLLYAWRKQVAGL